MEDETRTALEKLHQGSLKEQAKAEQDVFNGLNSTDTVLNLVREGMSLLSNVCIRLEGVKGSEDLGDDIFQTAAIFQSVLEEVEHTGDIMHQLEEHMVDYAKVNERLYQKICG